MANRLQQSLDFHKENKNLNKCLLDTKITRKVTTNLITCTDVTKAIDQVNVSFLSRIKFAQQQQTIGITEIAPALDWTVQENPYGIV